MIYMGEALSSTLIHVKPGILSSANVAVKGFKAWRFFPEPSMIKIEKVFKTWGVKCRKGRSSHKCRSWNCLHASAHSPIYSASSKFLHEHGIKFYDLLQGPGDVVVVNPGVGHCVVNLTFCVAEAKTLLPLTLIDLRNEVMCCQCPFGRAFVPLNKPGLFWKLDTTFMCPHKRCFYGSLKDRKEYHKHMASHIKHTCEYCGASLSTSKHLRRHIKNKHESEPYYCYPCQKHYRPSTFQNHPKSQGRRQAIRD